MSREDFLKQILDNKTSDNKIDLLVLYPIVDKALNEMQEIIYSKDEIIKSNIEQIRELQRLLNEANI